MAKKRTVIFPKRGEIYLVPFDPAQDSEINKTRPALILQNDLGNQFSPITIVAALTSKIGSRRFPFQVFISAPDGGIDVDSIIQLNQIRTIDKQRLTRRLGVVRSETMAQVERAILISLGITEV
jgi:mRNA interferase MazF